MTALPVGSSLAEPVNELHRAYREADKGFRVQQAKIGCILVLICMPLGLSLDWFVYPDRVLSILIFGRLLCDVAVLPLFLILRSESAERHVDWIGLAWPLLPAIAISWMIFHTEGSPSPYYAGLILVLIVACQLMPYSLWEAVTVCTLTITAYLTACIAHSMATGIPVAPSGLFNGFYFISITALICVCSSHYNSRRRITEFALRRELDSRNRELAQLDRLKSEFFANVSHELRTPLTLILAPMHQMLDEPDLPAPVRRPLQIVQQNALRLLKLITDLLEVVRLDEKAAVLAREPLDLASFARAQVDSMRQLAEQKQLRLHVSGGGGANGEPMVVEADPSRLEKIVLNLLTNAFKFTPVGGQVTVELRRNDGMAELSVRDNGIGIPAKDLPHIFERFRQADGSATRRYQGVGIGLALARELAQEHGGTLSVVSEEGQGATFTLRIPLCDDSTVDGSGNHVAIRTLPDTSTDPIAQTYQAADRTVLAPHAPLDWDELQAVRGEGKFEVLVIEDEPDLREFVVSLISKSYRVRQAADGVRGLEAVRVYRPHLVLLDLMLPEMDGLEVCRRIKSDPELRSSRVILLTARTDEASKLTGLRSGADDFLQKPFSTAELQSRVANLLQAADLEQTLRDRNTELSEAMAKLKATEVQLVQSEKMNAVGRLSAGILHEVNNPLNASLMAVFVAAKENKSAEVAECLSDIEGSLKRIQSVTTGLRTFAHPSTSVFQETFSVGEVVGTVEKLLSHELAGEPIEQGEGCNIMVRGSRNQITHVLINLLENALYGVRGLAGKRTARMMVNTYVERDRAFICVEDNGIGIRPEDLEHVTEPFFTRREIGTGMGLGLSICQTIVGNHGGSLRLESEHGAWTKVIFDLPCA